MHLLDCDDVVSMADVLALQRCFYYIDVAVFSVLIFIKLPTATLYNEILLKTSTVTLCYSVTEHCCSVWLRSFRTIQDLSIPNLATPYV